MDANIALNWKFHEATTRIGGIIHLATTLVDDSATSDAFEEFFNDLDNDQIAKAFGDKLKRRHLDEIEEDGEIEPAALASLLLDKMLFGFLVKFEMPVMTWRTPTSRSYSWGHYRTHWLYADTYEEAIEAGLKWAAECAAADRGNKKSA